MFVFGSKVKTFFRLIMLFLVVSCKFLVLSFKFLVLSCKFWVFSWGYCSDLAIVSNIVILAIIAIGAIVFWVDFGVEFEKRGWKICGIKKI